MRAALALAFALLGCDAVLGIEALPLPIDAAAESDVAPDECALCAASSCDAKVAACRAEATCAATYGQVASCPVSEPRCRVDFETDHASSTDETYVAADACLRTACAAACFGGGFARSLDKSCTCADDACVAEALACVHSGSTRPGEAIGACDRTFECIAKKPDPDGTFTCRAGAAGAPELDALRACLAEHACESCGLAHGELGCLGTWTYAPPTRSTVHYAVKVVSPAGTPLAGVTVNVCALTSLTDCTTRLGTDVTDATGTTPSIDFAPIDELYVEVPAEGGRRALHYFPRRAIHLDEHPVVRTFDGVTLASWASALGVSLQAGKAHLVGTVHDCVWNPLDQASFGEFGRMGELIPDTLDDEGATLAVFDGNKPKRANATTKTGTFAVLNLSPGPHTIAVHRGMQVLATVRHYAIADVVTAVDVFPEGVR